MPATTDQLDIQREDVEGLFAVGDVVRSGGGRTFFRLTEILSDRVRIQPTKAKTASRLYFNRISAVINNIETIDPDRIEKSVYSILEECGLKDTQNESYLYGFAKEFLTRANGRQCIVDNSNPKIDAIKRMAATAQNTTGGANGQQVSRTMKNKQLKFESKDELETYITELIDAQNGFCAITGLTLQYDGEAVDQELLCSLDRIDSDGHYEPGNLQVVCRFVNRWKNDSDNEEFRRLVALVRSVSED